MPADIPHHPALIDQLRGEHRLLLQAFGALKQTTAADDAPAFKRALQDFKALLVPHFLEEAIRLYTYLRRELKAQGNLTGFQRVNGYKSESGRIGDAALRFVETSIATPDDAFDFSQVRSTLHEIGLLLGDRIRREESDLYPLYQSLH